MPVSLYWLYLNCSDVGITAPGIKIFVAWACIMKTYALGQSCEVGLPEIFLLYLGEVVEINVWCGEPSTPAHVFHK